MAYRYHGKFVSESRYRSLANLPNLRKFLKSDLPPARLPEKPPARLPEKLPLVRELEKSVSKTARLARAVERELARTTEPVHRATMERVARRARHLAGEARERLKRMKSEIARIGVEEIEEGWAFFSMVNLETENGTGT